jgi:hypothetical protein
MKLDDLKTMKNLVRSLARKKRPKSMDVLMKPWRRSQT